MSVSQVMACSVLVCVVVVVEGGSVFLNSSSCTRVVTEASLGKRASERPRITQNKKVVVSDRKKTLQAIITNTISSDNTLGGV